MERHNLSNYLQLTRLNKPIGILLLLWPTLTALWIASAGIPNLIILFIFVAGVILTRSAGCILNDFADQKFDANVTRTKNRPLAAQKIKNKEALILCGILLLIAFILVLFLNKFTILLAIIAAILTAIYPFTKRITHLPQFVLGLTFNMGVLMAFTAVQNKISFIAWLLYLIALVWTVVYDTMYAMTDREDDLKIGIKSTAILFGKADVKIIAVLQLLTLILLIIVGILLHIHFWYYIALFLTALFFIYQQYLIRNRLPEACFKAFLNNHWAWFCVFAGVVLSNLY